jgi:hypothetical protein
MDSISTEGRRGFRPALLAGALAVALAACVGVPRLAPIPEHPASIQGDGSLSLSGPAAKGRSRFAFVLLPPARARVDVFDPFGRLVYFLLVAEDEALLAVPSRKAFARAGRDQVFARFLGFGLSPSEMTSLLTGRWTPASEDPEAPSGAGWVLKRDARGRVAVAERDGLRLEVREFFPDSAAPRSVAFEHPDSRGRIKVRRLAFDRSGPGAVDEAVLLKGYRERSWPEMEALLGDED